jgi:preprotein translocase subunit SecE
MSTKIETQTSSFDKVKWVIIGTLLTVGVVANSYLSAQPFSLRLAGWLVLICIVALIAFQTSQGKRVWAFAQSARMELRKVVWPTRQETVQTTLIVMAMVLIAALFLWGLDSLLLWLVGFLTGQRG